MANPLDIVYSKKNANGNGFDEKILVPIPGAVVVCDAYGDLTTYTGSFSGTGGGGIDTSSTYPITASWAINALSTDFAVVSILSTTASYASYARSASWSPSMGGTSLGTGSTYPITSSWSVSASSAVSASFAETASALNALSQSILPTVNNIYDLGSGTKHWSRLHAEHATVYNALGADNITANSYISTPEVRTTNITASRVTASLYGTASYAAQSVSSSYLSGSTAIVNELTASGARIRGAFNILSLRIGATENCGIGAFSDNAIQTWANSVGSALIGNGGGYTGIRIPSDGYFAWSDTTAVSSGRDTAIFRWSPGVVVIASGSSINYDGRLIASRIGIGTTAMTNSLDVVGNISCSVVTASLFFGTASFASSTLQSLSASYLSGSHTATVYKMISTNPDAGGVQFQAGKNLPFYLHANWPTLGFNAYYDGGWKYGAGSSNNFGAFQTFDVRAGYNGEMGYWFPTTTGSDGGAMSTARQVFAIYADGRIRAPITFTEPSLIASDTNGYFYQIPITGSQYPLLVSSASYAISASYAVVANSATNADFALDSQFSVSSSYANQTVSASYISGSMAVVTVTPSGSLATGSFVYNIITNQLCIYNGTQWKTTQLF